MNEKQTKLKLAAAREYLALCHEEVARLRGYTAGKKADVDALRRRLGQEAAALREKAESKQQVLVTWNGSLVDDFVRLLTPAGELAAIQQMLTALPKRQVALERDIAEAEAARAKYVEQLEVALKELSEAEKSCIELGGQTEPAAGADATSNGIGAGTSRPTPAAGRSKIFDEPAVIGK